MTAHPPVVRALTGAAVQQTAAPGVVTVLCSLVGPVRLVQLEAEEGGSWRILGHWFNRGSGWSKGVLLHCYFNTLSTMRLVVHGLSGPVVYVPVVAISYEEAIGEE